MVESRVEVPVKWRLWTEGDLRMYQLAFLICVGQLWGHLVDRAPRLGIRRRLPFRAWL